MSRLRHLLLLALLFVPFFASAHVIVYAGSLSQDVLGAGDLVRQRYTIVLVVDTEFADPENGRPNVTLFVYQRLASGYQLTDYRELDDLFPNLAAITFAGPRNLVLTGYFGHRTTDDAAALQETLVLRGVQQPVALYLDANRQVVSDTIPLRLDGTGILKYVNENDQTMLIQSTYSLRFHTFTRAVNPTGTEDDYQDALRYIIDTVGGGPPSPN